MALRQTSPEPHEFARRDNRSMVTPPYRPRDTRAARPGTRPTTSRPLQAPPPVRPLSEREMDDLQALLDRVPAPLEPLDVSMLDGFLCGVLVQPTRVPDAQWLPHITDADGRALPPRFNPTALHALALRRYAELNDAISKRDWFDPWVFELDGGEDDDEEGGGRDDAEGGVAPPEVAAVYPWVAGFATAVELFPALMRMDAKQLTEPLALLYRHLDAEDLEDAEDLLEEIESLEPPADLSEAVEGLVRATLLLADVGRPLPNVVMGGGPNGQHARQHTPGRGSRGPRR
jgi:uncharacterized protein